MVEHIIKRHNKTLLLYHIVFPIKYRRKIFSKEVEETLKQVCNGISERYEINFVEIGADEDHVHFLVQSIPTNTVIEIVTIIKSITAKRIFSKHKEVKKKLWGGNIWTSGYYANTVGQYANEQIIKDYIERQGKRYQQIYSGQLKLFDVNCDPP
ncbi:MAG: IS200/IS605 family transposase [Cyanobacteriota bacterium]